MATYNFTQYFDQAFVKNTGLNLDEDTKALISMTCSTAKPHKKIDAKGRNSHYFTMLIHDTPVTIVCDGKKKCIITAIKETHQKALASVNL